MNWQVEAASKICTNIRIGYSPASNWEQWVLITSDEHMDNPKCDRKLLEHHMRQAVDREAVMIKLGDTIDGMQGKRDPRSSKSSLRDENVREDYLNSLVENAADFYEPYAANIGYISKGNHETSLIKHYEFDVLSFLTRELRHRGSPVVLGGYRGWIRFMFERGSGGRQSINMYQIHGYGGGGPVTKDVIQASRKAVYLGNADIVASGHTHDRNIFPIERVHLMSSGREIQTTQHHIKTGTYKNEFLNIADGWAHEKGMPPKPVGGYWIEFYYSPRTKRVEYRIYETDK